MTYAAYLRIYEPVSAFHEPDRSRWAAYAASAARPRRRDSLMVEHAEALRRAITTPQAVIPERESQHAYVRHADGITYVCPWQTRLRCLLAYGRMLPVTGAPLPGAIPAGDDDQAMAALARLEDAGRTARDPAAHSGQRLDRAAGLVHAIRRDGAVALPRPGPGRASAQATAPATRALVYTTPMSRARRRVARGLAALRGLPAGSGDTAGSCRGPRVTWPKLAAGSRNSTRTHS